MPRGGSYLCSLLYLIALCGMQVQEDGGDKKVKMVDSIKSRTSQVKMLTFGKSRPEPKTGAPRISLPFPTIIHSVLQ